MVSPSTALSDTASDTTLFALALDAMDGVGRVTAGRLLTRFATHGDLLRYPREQVLARLKGAPRSSDLVATLFDQEAMAARLDTAARTLDHLRAVRVVPLALPDPAWPAGLNDLPRGDRPFLLYTYGHLEALRHPCVALFARPPLSPEPFEQAQALVRHLVPHTVVPATGAAHGFDVVVHKLCYGGPTGYPSLLVASAGMAKAPAPLRPAVSAVVKAGGLFLSPFAMEHGPFEHDDKTRALVLASLAQACVFFEPQPKTPEWHAMQWAIEAARPVFGIASAQHPLPDAVHRLQSEVDFDWVLAAVRDTAG